MDLLRNGASPDLCREDGWSPLHAAARFGHSGTAIALLEEGRADFEARTGDHGSTPLHVAAISGFDEVWWVLLFVLAFLRGCSRVRSNLTGRVGSGWVS